jgi:CBS domain containing-hemolysin-like protein
MEPRAIVTLAAALALFVLGALLSALLTALGTLGRVAIHRLIADSGNRLPFLQEMDSPASTHRFAASIGRQVALVGGCLLTAVAAHLSGWPMVRLVPFAVVVILGVVFLGAFARLLGLRYPRGVARWTALLVPPLRILLAPVVLPVAALARRATADTRNGENGNDDDAEDDAEVLIRVAEEEGILEEDEVRMMRGIVDLGETRVREVMTPRPDIVAMPADTSVREAIRIVRTANHSRFPVFRKSIDDVVGVLHVRDLVPAWDDRREEAPVSAFLRPPFFVPETRRVDELLAEMRTRTNMALVVDEYGGIEGLVTMEDLLEEIVGDIRDEHDDDEDLISREPDGSWLVSGLVPVKELEEIVELTVPDKRDYDTVGGLVVAVMGRVPEVGDAVVIEDLRIEVIRADPRRVYRVQIRKLPRADAPAEERV